MAKIVSHQKVAVIDMGSNTFHLLISHYDSATSQLTEVLKKRLFIYLAEGGQQSLSTEAIERGKQGIKELSLLCESHGVEQLYLVGTSALRMASNAQVFCDWVEAFLDLKVDIISGEQEALFIYKGISLTPLPAGPNLIMDIGGGSVEFILDDNGAYLDAFSAPIGISALRGEKPLSDKPTEMEIVELYKKIDLAVMRFFKRHPSFIPTSLIGSSGAFEILESYMGVKPNPKGNHILRKDIVECTSEVIGSTLEQRLALPYMPPTRADLSKESMLLISYILRSFKSIERLIVSPFAMKEGVLKDKLNLG